MAQAADPDLFGAVRPGGVLPGGVLPGGRGGAGDRPALRRCTHLDPQDFGARIWGTAPSLSRSDQLATGFTDLLDAAAVDHLLSRRGLRTPFLRVAKDGQTFPASRFTRGGGVGAAVADQVDDVALTRLFAEGATVVLQGLHRTHEPILELVQQLATDLGHPVQANAYVTPPQSRGFGDHYDVHDVFVLQVAGEKRWTIHEPVHRHPRRDQPWTDRRAEVVAAAGADPVLDVVLRPGDALYLPAGFLHAAEAQGETSIHLTLGLHVWTRAHLLDHLVAGLADVEALRRPLPLGVDVTDPAAVALEVQQTVDALVETLAAALPAATARDVAARLARTAGTASRAEPVGPLAQAAAVEAVDLWTRLRWRTHLRADVAESPAGPAGSGGQVVVRTPEGSVTLPAACRHGVERLIGGEILTAVELVDGHDGVMEDVERLEVARALLRATLVVPE